MRSPADVRELLNRLDSGPANDLEDQDLDFKEWNFRSRADSVHLVIEMAICMANGGGGTVVLGVNDKAVGRARAILGLPDDVDVNLLKRAVYENTDPRITPVIEELRVPEGTGRLLVMQVYPGLPPYTDTAGQGKIRIGTDCQPLTGTLRRKIMVETGETDFTAVEVPGDPAAHLSASAMEMLRETARRERAPEDLLGLGDFDLLSALGVIRNGRLTIGGLLLSGKESAIQEHVPGYLWTYFRMRSDTQYVDRLDGRDALPLALSRITDRLMGDNPITTVEHGLFHFEYRTYPEIALREALLNAFCHCDFRLTGPIVVKHFPHKIEIGNPGGFIGGISPDNILHHGPVARNPHFVEALTRLRLVNRGNLGIGRMFKAMLVEGKEPPLIEERGDSVKVTFLAREFSVPFRAFVEEESGAGRTLNVDHLLLLQYLLRHAELDASTAARLCQRQVTEVREILSEMERSFGYLERGETGRGTYWTLRADLHRRLAAPGSPDRDQRIDWEAAKARVLSILRRRAQKGEAGLTNREVRGITHLDRYQVNRLMHELQSEGQATISGHGRAARYAWAGTPEKE